jgi:hypothetical protein
VISKFGEDRTTWTWARVSHILFQEDQSRRAFRHNSSSILYPVLGTEKRGGRAHAVNFTPPGLAPVTTTRQKTGILKPSETAGGSPGNTPARRAIFCDHCKEPGHGFKDCPILPFPNWVPNAQQWKDAQALSAPKSPRRSASNFRASSGRVTPRDRSRPSSGKSTPRHQSGSPRAPFSPRSLARAAAQLQSSREEFPSGRRA